MTGPVTALGIRDGDPAVLRALIARRGSAVLAYCERACAPAQVPPAAADAFARFRALVAAAPRPAELDPEAALISSTRHAAATRAPHGHAPASGAGLGRLLGGRATADQVTLVPDLLIARADGTLDAEGEEQLTRLLDASAAARAAEERFRAAEHAYRSAPPRPIPDEVIDQIVAAMLEVPAPDAERLVATREGATASAARNGEALRETTPAEEAEHLVAASGAIPAEDLPAPPEDQEPAADEATAVADVAPEAPAPPEPAAVEEPDPPTPPESASVETPEAAAAPEKADASSSRPKQAPDRPREDDSPVADAPDRPKQAAAAPAAAVDDADDVQPSEEWNVPPEEPGPRDDLDVEIAAARLRPPAPTRAAKPAPAARAARTTPPKEPAAAGSRPSLPGRNALAPAAAVVAVAAVSILATSGVFGGDEGQQPVDTGVAPKRTQVEVPDGEAAAVVDELRRAAAKARRQRLVDQRAAAPPPVPVTPAPEAEQTTPEQQEEVPAPAQPDDQADEETPQDGAAEGGTPAGDATGDDQTAAEGTPPDNTTP